MMRQRFVLILMILVLPLAGCMAKSENLSAVPVETGSLVGNTLPERQPSAAATEHPAIPESQEPAATEGPVDLDENSFPAEIPSAAATEDSGIGESQEPAATVKPNGELPYLQHIDWFDQSIYDGPGYDYGFVSTVREPGIYTIVEEVVDFEGNLWGKLKSGIGWVDLTEIHSGHYKSALISANYADEYLLLHGAYHHYSSDEEYRIPVAVHAYGKLRNVALFAFSFSDDGLCPGPELFTLPEMTAEMPLVAELAFPGDMSTYGLRFDDEAGITHVYSIYISGRNGALILTEE